MLELVRVRVRVRVRVGVSQPPCGVAVHHGRVSWEGIMGVEDASKLVRLSSVTAAMPSTPSCTMSSFSALIRAPSTSAA